MPPTFAGREEHDLRSPGREPLGHRGLVAQIDFAARHRLQLDILPREAAHQRGANHAAMARDENSLAF
jgi:hypothetical protein